MPPAPAPSRRVPAPPSRGASRLTAEQQLAMQKKEKKGAKARKELVAEEEKLRESTYQERDAEFEAMATSRREDLDLTKDRLIRRLTANLDELKTHSSRTIRAADTDLTNYKSSISQFCRCFVDGIVDTSAQRLINENKPSKDIADAIVKLGTDVSTRLRDNEQTARQATLDLAVARQELRKTKEQLCAAETIISTKHVTSSTEYSSAAELFRAQGVEFEQRMTAIETERRAAFEAIITAAALPKYHVHQGKTSDGREFSCLDEHPAERVIQGFLTSTERNLIAQSKLLRDVQAKIAELTRQHITRSMDRARQGRSNLPEDVRGALREAPLEELLRLLDYVSFEPKVSEAITAVCSNRTAIENSTVCLVERVEHDAMTGSALSLHYPRPLTVMPPRADKMAFARSTLIEAADRVRPGFGVLEPPRLRAADSPP